MRNKKSEQQSTRAQAHMVTSSTDPSGTVFRSAPNLPELNTVCADSDWWIDTGANNHFCTDSSWFSSYQVTGGGTVNMGNKAVSQIIGTGDVTLYLSSGKKLHLHNVHYIPNLRRNLLSGYQLVKCGYSLHFEAGIVVIKKGGNFIGKGFACDLDGLFVLKNLMLQMLF